MMKTVSEAAQTIFVKLVAWAVLGVKEDPKALLREVPLADLSIACANVSQDNDEGSVVDQLLRVEMAYRTGQLAKDWELSQEGDRVNITMVPRMPTQIISIPFVA